MSLQGLTKSSASVMSALSKTASIVAGVTKAGQAWRMGQVGITMGGTTDPVSGLQVFMGALGSAVSMTAQTKS